MAKVFRCAHLQSQIFCCGQKIIEDRVLELPIKAHSSATLSLWLISFFFTWWHRLLSEQLCHNCFTISSLTSDEMRHDGMPRMVKLLKRKWTQKRVQSRRLLWGLTGAISRSKPYLRCEKELKVGKKANTSYTTRIFKCINVWALSNCPIVNNISQEKRLSIQ